jgi:LysR family transcriptional regulator, glycine cleavage system transcriptional activator
VAPDFACRWLLPRLVRFRERHPDTEVRIEAEDRLANFVSDGVDLAIRCGRGTYPGLRSELLMSDVVFPVCSAALLESGLPLAQPEDLLGQVLLHDSRTEEDGGGCAWQDWFGSAGLQVQRLGGPRFSNAHLAIEAAISGLGVALARATLVNDDIAEGRLRRALRHAMPAPYSYYLVHSPKAPAGLHLDAFVEWLRAEVAVWRSTACRQLRTSIASHREDAAGHPASSVPS